MSEKQTIPFGPKYILTGLGILAAATLLASVMFLILNELVKLLSAEAIVLIAIAIPTLILANLMGVVALNTLKSDSVKNEENDE